MNNIPVTSVHVPVEFAAPAQTPVQAVAPAQVRAAKTSNAGGFETISMANGWTGIPSAFGGPKEYLKYVRKSLLPEANRPNPKIAAMAIQSGYAANNGTKIPIGKDLVPQATQNKVQNKVQSTKNSKKKKSTQAIIPFSSQLPFANPDPVPFANSDSIGSTNLDPASSTNSDTNSSANSEEVTYNELDMYTIGEPDSDEDTPDGTRTEPDLSADSSPPVIDTEMHKSYTDMYKGEQTISCITQEEKNHAYNAFLIHLPELANVFEFAGVEADQLMLKRKFASMCKICHVTHEVGTGAYGTRDGDACNAFIEISDKRVRFFCSNNIMNPLVLECAPFEYYLFKQVTDKAHQGIADIFMDLFGKECLLADSIGPVFIWSENLKVWIRNTIGEFSSHISHKLMPCLAKLRNHRLGIKYKFSKSEYSKSKVKSIKEMAAVKVKYAEKDITRIDKFMNTIRSIPFMRSVAIAICQTNKVGIRTIPEFDRTSGVLPVEGGFVVNMSNGEKVPRTKEHYFTKELKIEYIWDKTCELFDNFLATIMLEDKLPANERVKVKFLQEIIGYALTAECNKKIMIIFTGEKGSNGKSTFCNLLQACFPGFVQSTDKSIIMKKIAPNSSAAAPQLDVLRCARLVFTAETNADEQIDESVFKKITGQDTIYTRTLFDPGNEWTPKFTLGMCTNNLPKCTGEDATLARILVFPFDAKFVAEPDPKKDYERKINTNMSKLAQNKEVQQAVLAWVVQGAKSFYAAGDLKPPAEILQATKAYQDSNDPFELFVKKEVAGVFPGSLTSFREIYDRYEKFCLKKRHTVLSEKMIGSKLTDKYGEPHKSSNMFYNVTLITRENPSDDIVNISD